MQKAVLFGCGDKGKRAYSSYKNAYDFVAMSDNNQSLWGGVFSDTSLHVIPPTHIHEAIESTGIVIICSGNYFLEIARQMEDMNLPYKIFWHDSILGFDMKNGFNIADMYMNIKKEPRNLSVQLSNVCNLRCRYCYMHGEYGNVKRVSTQKYMKWDTIKSLADQGRAIKSLKELTLIGRGETLLHPEWFEMTVYLLNEIASIESVLIYTNGMTLSESNVDKLANLPCSKLTIGVSIDGLSPKDTEYWRIGSSYSVIYKNLFYAFDTLNREIASFMIMNTVVLPETFSDANNYDEIQVFFESAGDWLRKDFPFAYIYTHQASPVLGIPISDTKVLQMTDPAAFSNLCKSRFEIISVTATGDILSCGCDKESFILGNVSTDNLLEVWLNNPRLNNIRQTFYDGTPACSCLHVPGIKRKMLVNSKNDFNKELPND